MALPPKKGSIPPIPGPVGFDRDALVEDGLVQTLFQENHLLREQIARHTHLMQLLTHQLATPLTTLSGSIHLLADVDLDTEQRQEFLTMVEQQIRHAQDLLHDVMALRNLETGSLEAQPIRFSVPELIADVMTNFPLYPVEYRFDAMLLPVWGDRWQVSQVLVNLISNAIKYSPDRHSIEIGAKLQADGWVEVWVQDYGLGIPEADQPFLFERFYRVKHDDRETIKGTGLGLSLCKLLVENQNGQIGFHSNHGQGSRFYFTLPIAEATDR
jgi:signal transduction histidine kinase